MTTFSSQKSYPMDHTLSRMRRLERVRRIGSGLRPKSSLGGTHTINGIEYTLHPTKGYRKVKRVSAA